MFNWIFRLVTYVSPTLGLNIYLSKMKKMHAGLSGHLNSLITHEAAINAWLLTHTSSPSYEKASNVSGIIKRFIPIAESQLKMIESDMRRIRIHLAIAKLRFPDDSDFNATALAIKESFELAQSQLIQFMQQQDKLREQELKAEKARAIH